MAVHAGPHNEAWKVVTNTGKVLETLNNGRDAVIIAKHVNRQTRNHPYHIPVQAVRA